MKTPYQTRIFSVLLSLVIVVLLWSIGVLPTQATDAGEALDANNTASANTEIASDVSVTESGTWGNLSWTLNTDTGVLYVMGTGNMQDFTVDSSEAWKPYHSLIETIIVNDTVTSIGKYAFYGCEAVRNVVIPTSVTAIGRYALGGCNALEAMTLPFTGSERDAATTTAHFGYIFGAYDFDDHLNSVPASLKKVSITDCTTIAPKAFYNCRYLTRINLPDALTTIRTSAFSGCSSLTSITIPKKVQSIGLDAFYDCKKLIEVYDLSSCSITAGSSANGYAGYYALIVHTSANIDSKLFTDTNGYQFYDDGTTFRLIGYTGDSTDVVLPTFFNMRSYDIHNYAFSGMSNLTSVTIPECVQVIGESAFKNCSSLGNLHLPKTLALIKSMAFYGCTALTNVVYGGTQSTWQSVTIYGSNDHLKNANFTFTPCTEHAWNTGEITTEPTEETTGVMTYTCSACGETKTEIIPTLPHTESGTWGNLSWTLNLDSGALTITGTGSMNGFGSSSTDAWRNYADSIKSAVIGDGITSIGSNAFYWCQHLTDVQISANITEIGTDAFSGCTSLTDITLPESLTNIGWAAFANSALTTIAIPDNVTIIQHSAFAGCSELESVSFGNNSQLKRIYDNAFLDAVKLTSIVLPDSVTNIGSEVFRGCTNLTTVHLSTSLTELGAGAFRNCEKLTSIEIPSNVSRINENTFYYCKALTSIRFAENSKINYIGNSAFRSCSALTGVYIPNVSVWCGINFASTDASPLNYTPNLYVNNVLLTELIVPASVTSIGNRAFYNCKNLTSVTFENTTTLKTIGTDAFSNCSNLTMVTVNDLTAWYTGIAFDNASSNPLRYAKQLYVGNSLLTELVIPDGVTEIRKYAFYNCESLTTVTIPTSVTSILLSAFNGCSNITDVYYDGTEDEWKQLSISLNNVRITLATIHFNEPIGDLNLDGVINDDDVLAMRRYLAGWPSLKGIGLDTADVNRDGEINVLDATILARYVAGWEGVVLG